MVEDASFSQLLDAIYCPICGGRLRIEEPEAVGGKRRLLCSRHGEMKAYVKAPCLEVKP